MAVNSGLRLCALELKLRKSSAKYLIESFLSLNQQNTAGAEKLQRRNANVGADEIVSSPTHCYLADPGLLSENGRYRPRAPAKYATACKPMCEGGGMANVTVVERLERPAR
jgi:hypothetical protein